MYVGNIGANGWQLAEVLAPYSCPPKRKWKQYTKKRASWLGAVRRMCF